MATATSSLPSSGERQQAAQSAIADHLGAVLLGAAWPELDPHDIKGSLPRFALAVASLVHRYGRASATQAVSFYRAERAAAGVRGRFTVTPADPAPLEQVQASLEWATSDLYGTVTPEKVQGAQAKVVGAAEKMTLDTGRNTILDAVLRDREAKGWARVPEPGACSFCLLLATRGAVYRSEQTGDFRSHDHCRCHAEPVFSAHYEPTAQVRAAQALYQDAPYGKNAAEARKNFRKALAEARANGHALL